MDIRCPRCGSTNVEGAAYCKVCQAPLRTSAQLKPLAAFAYLLGFVSAAILLNLEPYSQDPALKFHARQSIVFSVGWLALNIILLVFITFAPRLIKELLEYTRGVANLVLAVVWVYLMYQALTGAQYRLPMLADWADSLGL
jgi:uncharacterized membrane protein